MARGDTPEIGESENAELHQRVSVVLVRVARSRCGQTQKSQEVSAVKGKSSRAVTRLKHESSDFRIKKTLLTPPRHRAPFGNQLFRENTWLPRPLHFGPFCKIPGHRTNHEIGVPLLGRSDQCFPVFGVGCATHGVCTEPSLSRLRLHRWIDESRDDP